MDLIEVIILAIVQAITEFVPVSSSGHLIAVQELFNIESNLGLDVMLHAGTLIALMVYFWKDLMAMLQQLIQRKDNRLLINIIISTIPAVIAGVLWADFFESDVREMGVVILMLALVGVLMIAADYLFDGQKQRKLTDLSKQNALIIGLGQAIALIPGTSRSGISMLASRSQGLNNKDSARYAFLIGIPVIFGAAVKVLLEQETRDYIADYPLNTAVGITVAAIVGWLVLKVLIKFVAEKGLGIFGWYRLVLATLLFLIWIQ